MWRDWRERRIIHRSHRPLPFLLDRQKSGRIQGGLARVTRAIPQPAAAANDNPKQPATSTNEKIPTMPLGYDIEYVLGGKLSNLRRRELTYTTKEEAKSVKAKRGKARSKRASSTSSAADGDAVAPNDDPARRANRAIDYDTSAADSDIERFDIALGGSNIGLGAEGTAVVGDADAIIYRGNVADEGNVTREGIDDDGHAGDIPEVRSGDDDVAVGNCEESAAIEARPNSNRASSLALPSILHNPHLARYLYVASLFLVACSLALAATGLGMMYDAGRDDEVARKIHLRRVIIPPVKFL